MQRWLIACTRARIREEKRVYIFMCALSAGLSPADQMNPKLSIYEYFFIVAAKCIDTSLIEECTRACGRWEGTSRNFCGSEFCVWMFNGGFRTLLFTMVTDLIKQRTRRAFRATGTELKHAPARLHRAVPRSCIFWSRVSCFLTEFHVILNLYFRSIDSADW